MHETLFLCLNTQWVCVKARDMRLVGEQNRDPTGHFQRKEAVVVFATAGTSCLSLCTCCVTGLTLIKRNRCHVGKERDKFISLQKETHLKLPTCYSVCEWQSETFEQPTLNHHQTRVLQERNETWQQHSGRHNMFFSFPSLSRLIMCRKQAWPRWIDPPAPQVQRQSRFPTVPPFTTSRSSVSWREDRGARLGSRGPLRPIGSHSGTWRLPQRRGL